LTSSAPTQPSERILPVGLMLFWGLVGAAFCSLMTPLEPSLLEEGFHLHFAERVAAGEHLYRDLVTFTGPFPFEFLALLFRIFGAELEVARGAIVGLVALGTAATFAIAHRARGDALAHVAAAAFASSPVLLFPLFSMYFYTTVAVCLVTLATWVAIEACEERSGPRSTLAWSLAAGVLIALVALCKQTLGIASALFLPLALLLGTPRERRLRVLSGVLAGGALVTLLTLARYGLRGDLARVVDSLVWIPLSLEESFQTPFINLLPLGEIDPHLRGTVLFYVPRLLLFGRGAFPDVPETTLAATQMLFAFPFLIALLSLGRLIGRPVLGAPSPAQWMQLGALLALMTNLFPRPDWGHLAYVLPAAILQSVLLLPGLPLGQSARWTANGVAAAAATAFLVAASINGLQLLDMAGDADYGPRVQVRPVSDMYKSDSIPRVIAWLLERTEPGEQIFVPRAEPLIYFATRTRNPTPYGGVIPGRREEQEAAILGALEEVQYVVMSDLDQPSYNYYSDELPGVQDYFERYFDVPEYFSSSDLSWLLALERSGDRGETKVDLFRERVDARYWLRDIMDRELTLSREPPRLAAHFNRRPLPVVLGRKGGGVDFEVEIPADAVFQADTGLAIMTAQHDFYEHPARMELSVWIAPEGGDFEKLASTPVLDRLWDEKDGRDWVPMEVDLSEYAGQTVRLRLEATADYIIPPGELAWWGSPRIISRPGD